MPGQLTSIRGEGVLNGDGTPIPYRIGHRPRVTRRIHLELDGEGGLQVVTPPGMSRRDVRRSLQRSAARVASNEDWKQQDPQIPRSMWYHTDALGGGFRVVRPIVEPSDAEKAAKWDKTEPEQKDPEGE